MTPADLDALPAWIRWGRRQGAFLDAELLRQAASARGVHGRACGWCLEGLSGRRTVWCSDAHRDRFYRFAIWRALCGYIYERDEGHCRRCGSDHPGWDRTRGHGYGTPPSCGLHVLAWEVDHIVPIRHGGNDHPANLRLVCHTCHVAIGYEQRAAYRLSSRASMRKFLRRVEYERYL